MNRSAHFVLRAMVAAMLLMAPVALAWKWTDNGGSFLEDRRQLGMSLMLIFIPLFAAFSAGVAARQLASTRPRWSEDHRRHVQGAMLVWFVVLLAAQGWTARLLVAGSPPIDRSFFIRAVVLLIGMGAAVRGNFWAKLSPPSGEGAPAPAVWTRTVLTAGWALVALGIVLIIGAFTLPLRPLFYLLLAAAPVLLTVGVFQRRRLLAERAN
jgi:hypothetical protein